MCISYSEITLLSFLTWKQAHMRRRLSGSGRRRRRPRTPGAPPPIKWCRRRALPLWTRSPSQHFDNISKCIHLVVRSLYFLSLFLLIFCLTHFYLYSIFHLYRSDYFLSEYTCFVNDICVVRTRTINSYCFVGLRVYYNVITISHRKFSSDSPLLLLDCSITS